VQRIDFHILKNMPDSNGYLARFVEKVFLMQKHIFIYTATAAQAAIIDDILWTARPASFIPHQIILNLDEPQDPVTISHNHLPNKTDVLVNLSLTVPSFYGSFNRIIELVASEPASQEQSREKYRLYQSFGCQLHTFNIN
jgi:DNA polymerase III subunit chi